MRPNYFKPEDAELWQQLFNRYGLRVLLDEVQKLIEHEAEASEEIGWHMVAHKLRESAGRLDEAQMCLPSTCEWCEDYVDSVKEESINSHKSCDLMNSDHSYIDGPGE